MSYSENNQRFEKYESTKEIKEAVMDRRYLTGASGSQYETFLVCSWQSCSHGDRKALSYLCLVLDLYWTDGNQNRDLILLA